MTEAVEVGAKRVGCEMLLPESRSEEVDLEGGMSIDPLQHIELCVKELKGVVGLGQHQVTRDAARVERSVGVALMAYLLLLRVRAKQIKPGRSWSAFTLKPQFAWEVGARQLKRVARQEVRKEVEVRLAA